MVHYFATVTCHLSHLLSGLAGELFAQAPVREYPGVAVETVSDSSRYFVLRIQDDNGEDESRPRGPGAFEGLKTP